MYTDKGIHAAIPKRPAEAVHFFLSSSRTMRTGCNQETIKQTNNKKQNKRNQQLTEDTEKQILGFTLTF